MTPEIPVEEPITEESRRKMAVAVAQEILTRLSSFRLRCGNYVSSILEDRVARIVQRSRNDGEEQIQGIVYDIVPHCRVCLIGAAMFAKAAIADNLKTEKVFHSCGMAAVCRHDIVEFLNDAFSERTLNMMEIAFEIDMGVVRGSALSAEDKQSSILFGIENHPDSTSLRVAAVMRNVINNGGEFVPRTATDADEFKIRTWRNSH